MCFGALPERRSDQFCISSLQFQVLIGKSLLSKHRKLHGKSFHGHIQGTKFCPRPTLFARFLQAWFLQHCSCLHHSSGVECPSSFRVCSLNSDWSRLLEDFPAVLLWLLFFLELTVLWHYCLLLPLCPAQNKPDNEENNYCIKFGIWMFGYRLYIILMCHKISVFGLLIFPQPFEKVKAIFNQANMSGIEVPHLPSFSN